MSIASRELHHFLLLSADEQAQAIRRLAASGMSEQTIAAATRLSIEMVRLVIAGNDASATQIAQPDAPESETD